jgi:hypothetical protein
MCSGLHRVWWTYQYIALLLFYDIFFSCNSLKMTWVRSVTSYIGYHILGSEHRQSKCFSSLRLEVPKPRNRLDYRITPWPQHLFLCKGRLTFGWPWILVHRLSTGYWSVASATELRQCCVEKGAIGGALPQNAWTCCSDCYCLCPVGWAAVESVIRISDGEWCLALSCSSRLKSSDYWYYNLLRFQR